MDTFNKETAIEYLKLQIKQIQDFIDSGKKSISTLEELKDRIKKFGWIIKMLES